MSKQEEVLLMGETMVKEGGLLNAAQTAIVLEISRERVYELLELEILRKFEFLGRIYLSLNQVKERREADLKAGRPKRGFMKKLGLAIKATANMDLGQVRQGTVVADKKLERDVERMRKRLKK